MFADDGLFQISGNSRDQNQDKLENSFWKLRDFLNANGLKVNDNKTAIIEFMTHQKKAKTKGIPPDLTVREEVTDRRGRSKWEDKLITSKTSVKLLGTQPSGRSELGGTPHIWTQTSVTSSQEVDWHDVKTGTEPKSESQTTTSQ